MLAGARQTGKRPDRRARYRKTGAAFLWQRRERWSLPALGRVSKPEPIRWAESGPLTRSEADGSRNLSAAGHERLVQHAARPVPWL